MCGNMNDATMKTKALILTLNEEELKKVQIKALMLSTSVDRLLLEALNVISFREHKFAFRNQEIPCPHCRGKIKRKPYRKEFDVVVGNEVRSVSVRDYPLFRCANCNVDLDDMMLQEFFQKLLEEHIYNQEVKLGGKTITSVYFDKMIDFK